MRRTFMWSAGCGLIVAVAVATGAGAAAAQGPSAPDDDGDMPLTGSSLESASAAALAHTGGGMITETETGDDGAAYGVEIRTPDGGHVEVELDQNFAVVGEEADDGPDDD